MPRSTQQSGASSSSSAPAASSAASACHASASSIFVPRWGTLNASSHTNTCGGVGGGRATHTPGGEPSHTHTLGKGGGSRTYTRWGCSTHQHLGRPGRATQTPDGGG
eukprot:112672-Chlamydomonas_euryale.AAC.1